ASEMKALCAHPDVRREPDFPTILQHLTFCHSCSDRTALADIRRLPAGCLLRWRASNAKAVIRPYWRPRFSATARRNGSPVDPAADVDRLRSAVADATRRQ